MTASRTVLISGAGVAGPALAYWLRRHGFTPTVVERAPTVRRGGYKIDLRGAAIEVADRMGILAEVRRADPGMRTMSFADADGRRLATIPADLFMGRGDTDAELSRGDLGALLYDLTSRDVEYLLGDSIKELAQGENTVEVRFEHAPPRSFDLVVGADGVHSNVRALAFGDAAQFVEDLGYGVSIFSAPNHHGLDREELVHSVPGRTVNVYATGSAAEAAALLLFAAPTEPVDRRDVAQQKRFLADTFVDAGPQTSRLLDALDEAPDFFFDSVSQVRMSSWSRGRVAVVGDAGYCPSFASGQGTSLALVGAYVLAGELAAAEGDHVAAFAAYEREMQSFVEVNQKLGRDNIGRMVARSRLQSRLGVAMFKVLPRLPWRNAVIDKLTRPIHEAAEAITLKDYPAGRAELGVAAQLHDAAPGGERS